MPFLRRSKAKSADSVVVVKAVSGGKQGHLKVGNFQETAQGPHPVRVRQNSRTRQSSTPSKFWDSVDHEEFKKQDIGADPLVKSRSQRRRQYSSSSETARLSTSSKSLSASSQYLLRDAAQADTVPQANSLQAFFFAPIDEKEIEEMKKKNEMKKGQSEPVVQNPSTMDTVHEEEKAKKKGLHKKVLSLPRAIMGK